MTVAPPRRIRDPWLVIDGHPVVDIHPPVDWRPGGPGWIFVTDDRVVWEAGRGPSAVRAAAAAADVDTSDRGEVHTLIREAGPVWEEHPVAILERVATAWGSWFFGNGPVATATVPTFDPRGIDAFYRTNHQCPCGSGAIGARFKDERQQPAIACEACREKLLARIVEAAMLRGLPKPWSVQATAHGENYLRRKGCDLVKIVAGEPRPTWEGQVTILCPTVALFFVSVPEALAEAALEAGRLG